MVPARTAKSSCPNWRSNPIYRGRKVFDVPLAELGELEIGAIARYRFGARFNFPDPDSQQVRTMMKTNCELPPIIVEKEFDRWVVYDGHHTVASALEKGDTTIKAVRARKGDHTELGVIA